MKKTTVYIVDGEGKRIAVEVTYEVAEAMAECRKAEWRNDAKEKYYRDKELGSLSDMDDQIACRGALGEDSERDLRNLGIRQVFRSLTARQNEIARLLYKGKMVKEVAEILGVTHQSVSDIKKAISKKLKEFLK
ncbi:MAG: LuxR C-terminal-related transcriptional regulator [Firmicutes bacterium]|nr:LuxR C-terminal-related transcriptional regulator [Bacillota bacterium]